MTRILLLLVLSGAVHAQTSVADWKEGERILIDALRQARPEVRRWEVDRLAGGSATQTELAGETAWIEIVQLGARSAIRVSTPTDHGTVRRRTVWYAVEGFQESPTLLRSMAAGSSLDAVDVTISEADVIAAHCVPATIDFTAPGRRWRTKVSLRKGAPLCAADVEPSPPVSRGQPVTVTYTGSTLTLSTRGVAQNDGALGQRIPIKNIVTREIFAATVSGVAEVTVHE